MRWFINSTKETAGIPKADAVQSQIDTMVNEINHINDMVHDIKNSAITRSNTIHDALQNKGIQINNILKHQGIQDERIDEIEKGMDKFKELLRAAFNTITDLDNKVKALENQSMPKQSISEVKAKELEEKCIKIRKPRNRMKNTFSDPKFMTAYAIAHGYSKAGFNQVQIAGKLNSLGWKTPRGMEFGERHVSDLMCNSFQKARFMEGKEKKAKL